METLYHIKKEEKGFSLWVEGEESDYLREIALEIFKNVSEGNNLWMDGLDCEIIAGPSNEFLIMKGGVRVAKVKEEGEGLLIFE